jgi:hypothetical protein
MTKKEDNREPQKKATRKVFRRPPGYGGDKPNWEGATGFSPAREAAHKSRARRSMTRTAPWIMTKDGGRRRHA